MKPFGVVLNTDKSSEEGEHWFAMYCNPQSKKIVLYDSLAGMEDGKWRDPYYGTPEPVKSFLTGSGAKVLFNKKIDQHKTYELDGKRKPNDMCGAYAADALVMLGRANRIDDQTMAEIHKKHSNPEIMHRVFNQILHS